MVDRTSRPIVPTEHADEREHRRLLAVRASASMPKDGTEGMTAPFRTMQYATADLPDPTLNGGSLVYVTDGPALAYSDGVAWQLLTPPTVTPATILLASGTVTSAASLAIVLTAYTSYRAIRVLLTTIIPAVDSDSLSMQTSTDGGSTYASVGTDYAYTMGYSNSAGTGDGDNDGANSAILIALNMGNSTGEHQNIDLLLYDQTATDHYTTCHWTISGTDNDTNAINGDGSGIRYNLGDVDALQFFCAGGNIASLKYAVYGLL